MTEYEWLLFVHVLGAFLLVAGAAEAGAMHVAALRRERPSEIALLLGLSRIGVALVGLGSLVVLVFGIWLAEHQRYGVGDEWVVAAIVLWALAMATGAFGGRTQRHARELAERLARDGDQPSPELHALVGDRRALVLNYASAAVIVAILVLMVWKPGAY